MPHAAALILFPFLWLLTLTDAGAAFTVFSPAWFADVDAPELIEFEFLPLLGTEKRGPVHDRAERRSEGLNEDTTARIATERASYGVEAIGVDVLTPRNARTNYLNSSSL